MQSKLNLVFLLSLFFLNTVLWADDITDYRRNQFEKDFPTMQCSKTATLPYEGHYVTKSYWAKLEKIKIGPLPLESDPTEGEVLTVNIGRDGFIGVGQNYHEGQGYVCSFAQDNLLWACESNYGCIQLRFDSQRQLFISEERYNPKDIASLPKEIPMSKPLIRVGNAGDYTVYFEKIFPNKCYTSDVGEKWCFGKEEITIDNKVHKVYLDLSGFLMPLYGESLTFDDQYSENLFVFVPYKNGWKIFQDTAMDSENHIEVNPLTDTPWRILFE